MWKRLFDRRRPARPRVLAATRDAAALEALHRMADEGAVEVVEATSTAGVNAWLDRVQLVVLEPEALVPLGLSREGVRSLVEAAGVPHASPEAFLARPEEWLQQARAYAGDVKSVPPRVVVFTSLDSGGVGKTTLTLNLAFAFHRRTGLPTAVTELTLVSSGLLAVLAARMGADPDAFPDVHRVAVAGEKPGVWEGVTVLPMRGEAARLLAEEAYREVLRRLAGGHVLTVVDAIQPHPLWPAVEGTAIFLLATCTGREDQHPLC